MEGIRVVIVVGVSIAVLAGLAAGGGQVLVSAGLDQSVVEGDPVYLDGGGTHVPDGELDRTRWRIETPDGRTMSPDCPTCEVTQFRPGQTGTYEVTLTAWSSAGDQGSDTLYVTVEARQTPTPTPTPDGDTSPPASPGPGTPPGTGTATPHPTATPTPGTSTPAPGDDSDSGDGASDGDDDWCYLKEYSSDVDCEIAPEDGEQYEVVVDEDRIYGIDITDPDYEIEYEGEQPSVQQNQLAVENDTRYVSNQEIEVLAESGGAWSGVESDSASRSYQQDTEAASDSEQNRRSSSRETSDPTQQIPNNNRPTGLVL